MQSQWERPALLAVGSSVQRKHGRGHGEVKKLAVKAQPTIMKIKGESGVLVKKKYNNCFKSGFFQLIQMFLDVTGREELECRFSSLDCGNTSSYLSEAAILENKKGHFTVCQIVSKVFALYPDCKSKRKQTNTKTDIDISISVYVCSSTT